MVPKETTQELNVHDLLVQVLATQMKTNIILRSILNHLARLPHEHNADVAASESYVGR